MQNKVDKNALSKTFNFIPYFKIDLGRDIPTAFKFFILHWINPMNLDVVVTVMFKTPVVAGLIPLSE